MSAVRSDGENPEFVDYSNRGFDTIGFNFLFKSVDAVCYGAPHRGLTRGVRFLALNPSMITIHGLRLRLKKPQS